MQTVTKLENNSVYILYYAISNLTPCAKNNIY